MKRLVDSILRMMLKAKLFMLRIRLHDARETDNFNAVGDTKLREYAVFQKLKQLEAV